MKFKNKKMCAFVAGSAAILLFSMALPSKQVESTPAFEFGSSQSALANDLEETALESQLAAQRARSESLGWSRDPFQTPGAVPLAPHQVRVQSTATGPMLTGICTVAGNPMGIINREIVGVGDQLASGHTVDAIDNSTVILLLNGEKQTLSLGDER